MLWQGCVFGIPVSLFILTGLYNDGGAPTDDVSRGCAPGTWWQARR